MAAHVARRSNSGSSFQIASPKARWAHHPLAEARRQVKPGADPLREPVHVEHVLAGRQLQRGEPAHVHVRGRGLQSQERGVESGEP